MIALRDLDGPFRRVPEPKRRAHRRLRIHVSFALRRHHLLQGVLRQAVRDARQLLGNAIAGEHESYWLDRAHADVDLDEVERLLASANTAEPEHAQVLMESALRLFRGEPLAGADYAWSESEVPRLRATFVDLLEQVARQRLEA